jgi:two-component system, cell cycle response regulator
MLALVADDDPVTTKLVSSMLVKWGIHCSTARDGDDAWHVLNSGPVPSLAIVDWMMPGIDGIGLCRRIRSTPTLGGLYVIMLTGRDSRPDLITALEAGADDYMMKPVNIDELRARVDVGLRVTTLQQRLAERVSELQLAHDHLSRLVSTDVLTGVYSRRWWFDLAANEFSRSRRYGRALSAMAVDLDLFKTINDQHGHEVGDRVLQAFSQLLRNECRQSDVVGRLGGEEFAILVPEASAGEASHLAARVVDACRSMRVSTAAGDVGCTCSIGISEVQPGDHNIDAVLRRADLALYEAKRAGRDRAIADQGIASSTQP